MVRIPGWVATPSPPETKGAQIPVQAQAEPEKMGISTLLTPVKSQPKAKPKIGTRLKSNAQPARIPVTTIATPEPVSSTGTYREWYLQAGRPASPRRCQYHGGQRQCKEGARPSSLVCAEHRNLEAAVFAELDYLREPLGPVWMKNLKKYIQARFKKDLDWWFTEMNIALWTKSSDIIEFARVMVPKRSYEILKAMQENDTLGPAVALSRKVLREKYLLTEGEEAKLPERYSHYYHGWKPDINCYLPQRRLTLTREERRQMKAREAQKNRGPAELSDARNTNELRNPPTSLNPARQALLLDCQAIGIESKAYEIEKRRKGRRNGNGGKLEGVKEALRTHKEMEKELAARPFRTQLQAQSLAVLKVDFEAKKAQTDRFDEIVNGTWKVEPNSKRSRNKDGLKHRAEALRERQRELLGGELDDPVQWHWDKNQRDAEESPSPKKRKKRNRKWEELSDAEKAERTAILQRVYQLCEEACQEYGIEKYGRPSKKRKTPIASPPATPPQATPKQETPAQGTPPKARIPQTQTSSQSKPRARIPVSSPRETTGNGSPKPKVVRIPAPA